MAAPRARRFREARRVRCCTAARVGSRARAFSEICCRALQGCFCSSCASTLAVLLHAVTTAAVEIATASSCAAVVARTRSNSSARPRSLALKRSILARNAAFCDLRGLLRPAALRFAWFIYSALRCSRSLRRSDVRGVHIICSRADFFFSAGVFAARTTRYFIKNVSNGGPLGGILSSHGFWEAQSSSLLGSRAHNIGVSFASTLSQMPQMPRDAK